MLTAFRNYVPSLRSAVNRPLPSLSKSVAGMAQVNRFPSGRDEILSIDGTKYLVPFQYSAHILSDHHEFSLVTVFHLSNEQPIQLTEKWLHESIDEYKNRDDVFTESFLSGVIFYGPSESKLTNEAQEYLKKYGNKWIKFLSASGPIPLPGPYASYAGNMRDVWKLVEDSHGTCMTSIRPQLSSTDPFETLYIKSLNNDFLDFAISSRIKAQANIKSPISGWRIVIKDNIDLKGVKTSVGNRAFFNTYPPRSKTAANIQKVIEKGVIVSGKAKMNSFGNWEEPTEYVDYQAPWNPRGDGYQSTGGSSSGSAAAIAAYDWLDIAVGTDSWGSITRPALWCGCFGLRPSIGAASTAGIQPYVPTWDMPGILGRDLAKLAQFAAAWLEDDVLVKDAKPISAIIWTSDFWSIIDSNQCEIARKFVKDIEKYLGLKSEDISFEDEWKKSPPTEAESCSLTEYINPALSALAYDIYHNEDDLRERYAKQHGRPPYTSPRNQRVWNKGKTITKEERDAGFEKITVYERWFNDTILTGNRANALIIHPQENMAPRYRDTPPGPEFKRPPQDGICSLSLAAVLKSPALAVPIAQIPYESTVSDGIEQLPFVVTLVSPPGTDLYLLETTQKILHSAGRPISVKTGKVMFD